MNDKAPRPWRAVQNSEGLWNIKDANGEAIIYGSLYPDANAAAKAALICQAVNDDLASQDLAEAQHRHNHGKFSAEEYELARHIGWQLTHQEPEVVLALAQRIGLPALQEFAAKMQQAKETLCPPSKT